MGKSKKEMQEVNVEKVNKFDGKRVLITHTPNEIVDFIEEKVNNTVFGLKRGALRKKLLSNIKPYKKNFEAASVVMVNDYHFLITVNGTVVIDVQSARTTKNNLSLYWKSIDLGATNKVDTIPLHKIDHSEYDAAKSEEPKEATEETETTEE